jgi:hypothetical protein
MPDPRAPWTQADYIARHDFEAALDTEISQLDTALNSLDAIRRETNARLKPLRGATPQPAIVAQGDALLARATAIVDEMTSNPRNDEDSVLYADKVRERVETLLGNFSESQQPPFAAHRQQADEIHADVERVLGDYQKFVQQDVAAFNAVLSAGGMQPLKM